MKLRKIKDIELFTKVIVILLAGLTPAILLLTQGYKPSLSSYWRTDMQPLFIFSNALTAYYLYSIKSWRITALTLLLLTSFSVESYSNTHNVIAVLFFVSALIPFYRSNHYKNFFWLYLLSMFIMPLSLMSSESIAIMILCTYHGMILNRIHNVQKNRDETSRD